MPVEHFWYNLFAQNAQQHQKRKKLRLTFKQPTNYRHSWLIKLNC